jgi:anaphase-promoting complex subunit 11
VARSHRRVARSLRSSLLEQPPLPSTCACITYTTMKVTIKKWHAVATWRWDMPEDEVCGICRVQFDGTCPTCKYPGDDCTLRWWSGSVVLCKTSDLVCSHWEMRPFLSYGISHRSATIKNTGADDILFQHCILTWIQQDSAKGQCPMCRQSEQAFKNKGIYFLIQSRVRVETRRRMKKAEHCRFA